MVALFALLVGIETWSLTELQALNSAVLTLQNTTATKAEVNSLDSRVGILEFVIWEEHASPPLANSTK